MSSESGTSTVDVYLTGLAAPQSVATPALHLMAEAESRGAVRFPLPPMIPLAWNNDPPSPPVTGLLPPCDRVLTLLMNPEFFSDDPWLIWSLESNHWVVALAQSLRTPETGDRSPSDPVKPVGIPPLCRGIPIALMSSVVNAGTGEGPLSRSGHPPIWRTMNLVCWHIEYIEQRPWVRSCFWQPIWWRRLRRPPE